MIKEMTTGDKGKMFSLLVPLFTLPTQQDCVLPVLCVNTFFITFFGKRKNLVGPTRLPGQKRGIVLGHKNYATPTNEDLGQTSIWSKLVAAYLPVAQLKHGAILYNEPEVFGLSITNPNGQPMLPFDWLICSSVILASCHRILLLCQFSAVEK